MTANAKLQWLNTTRVINDEIEKPCAKLKYCPYGQLVECFPFSTSQALYEIGVYHTRSCAIQNGAITQFGHDCPAHYLAEYVD